MSVAIHELMLSNIVSDDYLLLCNLKIINLIKIHEFINK
jgi:hypothetical protein